MQVRHGGNSLPATPSMVYIMNLQGDLLVVAVDGQLRAAVSGRNCGVTDPGLLF
jgi:hypothetical protein